MGVASKISKGCLYGGVANKWGVTADTPPQASREQRLLPPTTTPPPPPKCRWPLAGSAKHAHGQLQGEGGRLGQTAEGAPVEFPSKKGGPQRVKQAEGLLLKRAKQTGERPTTGQGANNIGKGRGSKRGAVGASLA